MASTLTDLNNFDLIAVPGPDAAKFLQGQLTCNVDVVSLTHSVTGAYCSVNGRVISDLRLLSIDSTLHLVCSRGMGAALKKTLDKYIVFSKAQAVISTSSFERYGLHGSSAEETLCKLFGGIPEGPGDILQVDGGVVYRLADKQPRFEILVSVSAEDALDKIQSLGVTDDLDEWELADIRQGIVHISPVMQDSYTPQLLNYDLNGSVDFKKGCYTGQEIIARMHYRGAAKKRLFLAKVEDVRVTQDSRITHQGESTGEIISFTRTEEGHYELLAILSCDLVDQKAELMLQNDDSNAQSGQLKILPLPH